MLINELEKVGIENLKNPKALNDYSRTIDDVYENLEDCNPTKKRRVLIVFDDMIADMESNKELSPIVSELFLRGKNLIKQNCRRSNAVKRWSNSETRTCWRNNYFARKKRRNIRQIEKHVMKTEHYKISKLLNDSTV